MLGEVIADGNRAIASIPLAASAQFINAVMQIQGAEQGPVLRAILQLAASGILSAAGKLPIHQAAAEFVQIMAALIEDSPRQVMPLSDPQFITRLLDDTAERLDLDLDSGHVDPVGDRWGAAVGGCAGRAAGQ